MDFEDFIVPGFLIVLLAVLISACSYCSLRRVDLIKENAQETWKNNGYEVVGYRGYEMGNPVAGAQVWYILKRVPDNGILYTAGIQWWFGEYHIYDMGAVDAIKPAAN